MNAKIIIRINGDYELPENGRDSAIQNFMINEVPPTHFYIQQPSKNAELWYAHPFFGKSTLCGQIPYMLDGDFLPKVNKKDRVIIFSNRLDIKSYHFYFYLSDRLALDRLKKLDDQGAVNAIHRLRLVNLGYSVLNNIFSTEGVKHLVYLHTDSSIEVSHGSGVIHNARIINCVKEKNLNYITQYGKE